MTLEAFQHKIIQGKSFYKYSNYIVSVLALSTGLFFIYLPLFTDWYEIKQMTTKNIIPIWGVYIFGALFFLFGSYGFWRIPITYKITTIHSENAMEQKKIIIEKLINDFKLQLVEIDNHYWHLTYVRPFRNSFDIYLLFDEKKFFLNAQPNEIINNRGFIDFGTSKRITQKIGNNIIEQVKTHAEYI